MWVIVLVCVDFTYPDTGTQDGGLSLHYEFGQCGFIIGAIEIEIAYKETCLGNIGFKKKYARFSTY